MPGSSLDSQRATELQASRRELLHELDDALSATGIRQRKRAHLRRSLGWIIAERTASALHRASDIVISFLLLLLLSPILLLGILLARLSGGGVLRRQRLGRWATRFNAYEISFPKDTFGAHFAFLSRLPSLLNVLKGDMSFIGPRPIAPGEEFAEKRIAWKRYNLRPGLLSLWWIRKRANLAYSSEVSLDLEYVETQNFWGDLGIAARAIPAALYSSGTSNAPPQISFLGVRIDNLTMAEASAQIVELTRAAEPSQVSFVNADCVNIACKDLGYRCILSHSRLVLADGIGVRLAGSILNQNVRENVNGTDMFPYLCAAIEQAGRSIYLLGGKPGVAEAVAEWITTHYPTLTIAGYRDGYFKPEQQPEVAAAIEQSGASIVLVALGCPRQEKWIADWITGWTANHPAESPASETPATGTQATGTQATGTPTTAKVFIGVGGLFDFYSGRIDRAPVWVRELGMEWLYRFTQEPGRMWRRYFIGNFKFLYRVMGERFRMRSAQRAEGNTR